MFNPTLSPQDEAALLTILRQTFGPACRIADTTYQTRAEDYVVLLARLEQPALEVIIKLAGPRAPVACPFDRMAAIARLVRTHTTVPVFGVVAVDVSYRQYPWRYMVATHLQGKRWNEVWPTLDAAQLEQAYRQLGDAVARIHNIPFAEFGELAADATLPFGSSYTQALFVRARRHIHDSRLAERYIALVQEYAAAFTDVSPGLTHEDLNPNNVLFSQEQGVWKLAGIVDFDNAWAGCPESDLARMEFWRGMMGPGFGEAYTALRAVSPQYPQRRLLYQLLWCLEYAKWTPQHREDTRRVCGLLGVPAAEFMPPPVR